MTLQLSFQLRNKILTTQDALTTLLDSFDILEKLLKTVMSSLICIHF